MGRFHPASIYQLLRFIRTIPFTLRLTWRLLKDRRVPLKIKCIPVGGLLYLIFPLDLLNDFLLPLLGYMDDLLIIIFALNLFIRLSPPEVVREHIMELQDK